MLRRRPREPLFETVLVEDGRIRLFDQHLLRLRRGGATGHQLTAVRTLAGTWIRTVRSPTTVRFDVAAGAQVTSRPRTPLAPTPVRLATVAGYDPANADREQKRAARDWATPAEAEARERGADEPLLVSPDGLVGETSRASLFLIAADGTIATPPVRGLLPGVTRAWALATLDAAERPLTTADLTAARAAFITTAGRGVVRVTAIDARPLGTDERVDRLADAWRALR